MDLPSSTTRRRWTAAELEQIGARYPHEPAAAIARDLDRSVSSVHMQAYRMGIGKSETFSTSAQSGRFERRDPPEAAPLRRRRRAWSMAEDELLRARYPMEAASALAAELGRTLGSVHSRAKFLGVAKSAAFVANMADVRRHLSDAEGSTWSSAQREALIERYPHEPTQTLADDLGHPLRGVYQMAYKLGLRKSDAFRASAASGRLLDQDDPRRRRGFATRFHANQIPWNKGTRFVAGGRSAETRFRQGNRPQNWRPIGTLRVVDGYLSRKIAEPPWWAFVHRQVWEAAHGPIPAGHAVVFKSGKPILDEQLLTVDTLELVTRAELMRRNTIHRYPREVRLAIRSVARLERIIAKETEDA